MKNIILASLILVSVACNKDDSSKPKPKDDNLACPNYVPMNHEDYQLNFQQATAPEKISVFYNGVEKFNSCSNLQPDGPPIAYVSKNKVNPMMTVRIVHFGTSQVPAEADIEIVDLKDCAQAAETIFKADNIPLEFKTKNIGPVECNIQEKSDQIAVVVGG